MEIEITKYWNDGDHWNISNSVFNLGPNAARDTWARALESAKEFPLIDTLALEDSARAHFSEYGAWDDEEISEWNHIELTAMVLQEISECHNTLSEHYCDDDGEFDWAAYNETECGRIFQCDYGNLYFYLGL